MNLRKTKIALLDADFTIKTYHVVNQTGMHLADEIMKLQYFFGCHRQIVKEVERHNSTVKEWLNQKICDEKIIVYSDETLLELLKSVYGAASPKLFLMLLKDCCNSFSKDYYETTYSECENFIDEKQTDLHRFSEMISAKDELVGTDNDLGELKSLLTVKVLQFCGEGDIFLFCSDDKRARLKVLEYSDGNVRCVSGIGVFYVLKKKNVIDEQMLREYFKSWLSYHLQLNGQTAFRIRTTVKPERFGKVDGRIILEGIMDGTIFMTVDGFLQIR